MSSITLSTEEWAEQQFGECQFGDERRTRRAVRYATQVANNSRGSTPSQTLGAWSDCKAAYRLINREEVTHEALQEPHWRQTRARTAEDWLLLGDTTEVEYGIRRKIKGLGPTGNGSGRGFFVHSSLMIGADSEEVVGLLGRKHDGEPGWQTIWRGFDNLVPALILADGAQEMWVNLSYEPWDAKVRAEFCVSCCSANDLGVPAQPCGLDGGDCKLVISKCKVQIEYTEAETAGHHRFSICIY